MSHPAQGPHKKQLAVVRRLRVPGPEASWPELHEFAQTYDAAFFLSTDLGFVAKTAYRPVFAAVETGEIDGTFGVDLLRAGLWFQARSDSMTGAENFTSDEVEQFYRRVCAELFCRTGGWVGEQS